MKRIDKDQMGRMGIKLRSAYMHVGALTLIACLSATSAHAQGVFDTLYWGVSGQVVRSGLELPMGQSATNRTDVVNLISNELGGTTGVAIDVDAGKLYWIYSAGSGSSIMRADLDGTNVEELIADLTTFPTSLGLDPQSATMFWTDADTDTIHSAGMEIPMGDTPSTRSDIVTLISSGIQDPDGLAVDSVNQQIYSANPALGTIQRSDFDGMNIEELVAAGTTEPVGIALDVDAGMMYWTDGFGMAVRSAGMDIPMGQTSTTRTDIVTVISTSPAAPHGIAVADGFVYWSELFNPDFFTFNGNVRRVSTFGGAGEALILDEQTLDFEIFVIGHLAALPCAENDCDLDGVLDSAPDNCPKVPNFDQADFDGDGFGDVCDTCPINSNPSQTIDTDGDQIPDACDECPNDPLNDGDGDTHCDAMDNCPGEFNLGQSDSDFDGLVDIDDIPCFTTTLL